mgnify:CR=1 FL=1
MRVLILGVCGTFMAGIAMLAKQKGFDVIGCDENVYPPMSTLLESQGIEITQGYNPEDIPADVDQVVERRVRRFEQEQKLGIKGIEGRLSALEKKVAGGDGNKQLENELAALKKDVQAIDSSRAQFTSRLVRLSEEVNQLRNQMSVQ